MYTSEDRKFGLEHEQHHVGLSCKSYPPAIIYVPEASLIVSFVANIDYSLQTFVIRPWDRRMPNH
jgi:hypothetical protein